MWGIVVRQYEKHTLIKFTLIYFLSTAFFILALGYFYQKEQANLIIQEHTMEMHQYIIKLKQSGFSYKEKGYDYIICNKSKEHYKLAQKDGNYYTKAFPYRMGEGCILVKEDAKQIDKELYEVKKFTLMVQFLLLSFFLLLAYLLAKMSLKPLEDTISHLDRFIKDLIHDLNTPIASIQLNTKLLKNTKDKNLQRALTRLEHSTAQLTSLYDNLEIVLKRQLSKEQVNLYTIFQRKKEEIELEHPEISFIIKKQKMKVFTNEAAISRIIDNILSNSVKYAKDKDAKIVVDFIENTLVIQDNGKGMQYPQKIFERSYKESQNGHGIGMHIVQRLCSELGIKIEVNSIKGEGMSIELTF